MLRVITLNANGVRAAARKGFFAWLAGQDADVVCLQEVKAHGHQLPDDAVLDGYTLNLVEAERRGYSGVAIYSRRVPDRVQRGLGWPDFDAEGRFIQADFGELSVVSLYVPSGTMGPARQAVKEDFIERFTVELRRMRADGRRYVLCGDFNIAHREIDVFDPRSCARTTGFLPGERAWFDRVIGELGWVDAFRRLHPEPKQYTWWSNWPQAWERNLGWRIDYQLVTPDVAESVRAASIYRGARFSDHAPLTVDYALE